MLHRSQDAARSPSAILSPPHRRGALVWRRWWLLPPLVATALALIWWWPQAWIPAALAVVVSGLYATLAAIDRQAHRPRRGGASPGGRLAAQERVAFRMVAAIGVGLAAIAVVLAAALLDARMVAVGALLLFTLMVFLGWPFWAAAIAEEAAAVRHAGPEPKDAETAQERWGSREAAGDAKDA